MTAHCHCTVIQHPAGPVWVAHTVDRTRPQHYYDQPWRDA